MVDFNWLFNAVPALPPDGLLRWARPAMWAVVVAAAAAWAVPRLWQPASVAQGRRVARWAAAAVALWCLLPAPWSLAFHLSLAFVLPSWTAVLLCGHALWQALFATYSVANNPHQCSEIIPFSLKVLWAGAMLMGVVLMADTFVLLPVVLYRWGFGTVAVAVCALAVAVLWASSPTGSAVRLQAFWLALALSLHVVTRLPSGNVFDAVLDPLLWAWLVWTGLSRCFRGARPASATATRG